MAASRSSSGRSAAVTSGGAISRASAASVAPNCLTTSRWAGLRSAAARRNVATAIGGSDVRLAADLPSFDFSAGESSRSISGLMQRLDACPDRREIGIGPGQARLIGGQLGFGADRPVKVGSVVLRALERLENGEHPVVVDLRERLELVVMAAGAAERDSQKRRSRRAEHVVKLIVAVNRRFGRLIVPRAQTQKRGGDLSGRVRPFDFIAGKLLGHESAIRFVAIERVDDIVAVSPRVRLGAVALVAVGLGESHNVQPVPAEALAVMRAGQQAIDHSGNGIRRSVVQEFLDLERIRRKTDQIEVQPADERSPIGCGRGLDPLSFHPGKHEPVNRIARPLRVRHAGTAGRLIG